MADAPLLQTADVDGLLNIPLWNNTQSNASRTVLMQPGQSVRLRDGNHRLNARL